MGLPPRNLRVMSKRPSPGAPGTASAPASDGGSSSDSDGDETWGAATAAAAADADADGNGVAPELQGDEWEETARPAAPPSKRRRAGAAAAVAAATEAHSTASPAAAPSSSSSRKRPKGSRPSGGSDDAIELMRSDDDDDGGGGGGAAAAAAGPSKPRASSEVQVRKAALLGLIANRLLISRRCSSPRLQAALLAVAQGDERMRDVLSDLSDEQGRTVKKVGRLRFLLHAHVTQGREGYFDAGGEGDAARKARAASLQRIDGAVRERDAGELERDGVCLDRRASSGGCGGGGGSSGDAIDATDDDDDPHGAQQLIEALAARSCTVNELAALFVGLCRAIGVKARYVSVMDTDLSASGRGPTADKFAGKRAKTHGDARAAAGELVASSVGAWAEVNVWPSRTWVPFDPAHALQDDAAAILAANVPAGGSAMYIVAVSEHESGASYGRSSGGGQRVTDVTRRYDSSTAFGSRRVSGKWWLETIAKVSCVLHNDHPDSLLEAQEATDLAGFTEQGKSSMEVPKTKKEFKNHPKYVLKSDIKKREVLKPDARPLGMLKGIAYYDRASVSELKSKSQWLNQNGMEPKGGAVPVRSEKRLAGSGPGAERKDTKLYGDWQLKKHIVAVARNGQVPKDEYDSVKLLGRSQALLPGGCVWIDRPRVRKAAGALGVDCAKAVVDFENSGGHSHPKVSGIVVCKEFEQQVLKEYATQEAARNEALQKKEEARLLTLWKGLIVRATNLARMQAEYE